MTTLAILGTGRVATALATRLAAAGHDIAIGSRDHAAAAWRGPAVALVDHATAIRGASLVVNATPGATSLALLSSLADALAGRVLVDVANATAREPDGTPGGLLYPGDSLGERLQRALPRTRVVKTLSTMLFTVMANPRALAIPPTAFLSGDDDHAKTEVRGLLADLGWPPGWIEDLGDIRTARGVEAAMLLVPALVRRRGLAPFALTVAR
jgi:8-hydroxy-5-deazaflavin:NADPH oxidoreductase